MGIKETWKRGEKKAIAELAGINLSNLRAIFSRQRQPRAPLIFKLKKAADEVLGVGAVTLEDLLRVKDTTNRFFD
jgi:hypothetical protein